MKTLLMISSFLMLTFTSTNTDKATTVDDGWGEPKELRCMNSKMECAEGYSYNHCEMLITDDGHFFGISNIQVNHKDNYARFEPEVKFYNSAGKIIVDEVWTPTIWVCGTGSDPGHQVFLYNKDAHSGIKNKYNQIAGFSYSCRSGAGVFKDDDCDDDLKSSRHNLTTSYHMIKPWVEPKPDPDPDPNPYPGPAGILVDWYTTEDIPNQNLSRITVTRNEGLNAKIRYFGGQQSGAFFLEKGEWVYISHPSKLFFQSPFWGSWHEISY